MRKEKKKRANYALMLLKNNSKRNHIFESSHKNIQVWIIFIQVAFGLLLISRFLSLHGAEEVGRNITV